jgi:hypothetical protein
MICLNCSANSSQANNFCPQCGASFTSPPTTETESNSLIKLPKLFSREPNSDLFVIRGLSPKEMKNGVPEINLANIPLSDWPEMFNNLRSVQFALSSDFYTEIDALVTANESLFFVQNNTTAKFKKNQPFPIGPATITLQIPDTPSGEILVLDLQVQNVTELVQVAKDFFERPKELLALHNWVPFENTEAAKAPKPNPSHTVAPQAVTTYFVTEEFDI